MMSAHRIAAVLAVVLPLGWGLPAGAAAENEPAGAAPSALPGLSAGATPSATAPAGASPTAAASSEERKTSLTPKPAHHPPAKMRFLADPLSDGAVLAIAFGFVGLSSVIMSSGELKPQQPVASSKLTSLDRYAITQTVDPNAGRLSNFGLYGAIAFAIVGPVVTGVRESSAQAFLVDAMLYLQSTGITGGLTNLAKIAVRRPRPRAYIEQQRLLDLYGDRAEEIGATDYALSFPSGHASTTAAIAATATYLAFARAGRHSPRPWITLVVGVLATAFVGYERVRAGAHFPTDVIGGALIGGGVGVLVPHIHREQSLKERPVWIGYQPRAGGGIASLSITL